MTTILALSSSMVAGSVAGGILLLFFAVLAATYARSRRADKSLEHAAIEDSIPPEASASVARPDTTMSRRDFFRTAWLSSLGVFLLEFGGATLAFLWPNLKGGFGAKISVGTVADIKAAIASSGQPFYYGAGRFYIVPYDGSGVDEATGTDYKAQGVLAEGLMPLYQRCVHLGCRVPFCSSSKWFECPCHGSKYNEAGEYTAGPAPTGMQRFKIEVGSDGGVTVDTSEIVAGPARGTDTTKQSPEGPFCV